MKKSLILMAMSVAGVMALAANAQAHDMDDMHHHMMHGPDMCMQSLPADKQKMIHETWHRQMESDKPTFERMRKLHERMMQIGSADKFDRKAFLATGNEMAALHMKMEEKGTETMASLAEKLTADERRGVAKCMESKHHGDFHHEHHEGSEAAPETRSDYGNLNR
jgi:Spy/CpxP family protein refolding chaperone